MNVKKIYRYGLALTLMVITAACSNDADSVTPYHSSNKSKLNLSGVTKKVNVRTDETSIEAGKETGISLFPIDEQEDVDYNNCLYIAQESGRLTPNGENDSIFLTKTHSYKLAGYMPYKADNNLVFNINDDVLWADATINDVALEEIDTHLIYKHLCAQLSFKVKFDNDYVGEKVFDKNSSITVGSFDTKATLTVETGALTPNGEELRKISQSAQNEGGVYTLTIPTFCFFTTGSTQDIQITIVHNNKEYNGTLSDTFEAGVAYKCTVNLRNDPEWALLSDISVSFVNWTPRTGSLDLNEQ